MVEVVDVGPQIVLSKSAVGKYEQIGVLIGELFGFAMSRGAKIAGPPIFVCHEGSAEESERADREGNANIEVALPVAEYMQDTGDIKCHELQGGQMAKVVHKGPYEQCGSTYEALFTWIAQNGKQITGHTREVYLNDPHEVPPEEILTEIYAPIL